ncbi:protein terminal ear1-like [Magnolia sinica]|uniref:protein terminal ear1-like n=1 Tax=Magnolia sinica TaxID=86752 RepID=UPI00265AB2BC|nr:protein terminal ear1-like [Magnolia sinica]
MARLNPEAPEFNPLLIPSVPYFHSNPSFSYSSSSSCCYPTLSYLDTGPPYVSIQNTSFSFHMGQPWPDPLMKDPFLHGLSWDQQTPSLSLLPAVPVHAPLLIEEEESREGGEGVVAARRAERVSRVRRQHRRRIEGIEEGKGKQVWKPKVENRESSSDSKEEGMQVKAVEFRGGKTTLMIRNIPNKYTREMLLELLDKHCMEENEKLGGEADDSNQDFSAYDFVYLPIDFGSGCNLGYAFVNLTCEPAACRLHRALHRHRWGILGSKKICEISYAKIQGKEALLKHFHISTFTCDSDEFLPITFEPYRNGSSQFEACTIGKRITRSDISASCG